MLRKLVVPFVLALAIAGPATAEDARKVDMVKRAQVGKTLILNLPGKRAAGQRWYFLEKESQGLERVEVMTIGWILAGEGSKRLFGGSDVMRFGVRPKAPGEATLVFQSHRTGLAGRYVYIRKRVRVIAEAATARN